MAVYPATSLSPKPRPTRAGLSVFEAHRKRPDPPLATTVLDSCGRPPTFGCTGDFLMDQEESMADQNDEDKKNMRIMWIASGLVVLFILGLMFTIGAPTPTTNPATDMSSQSRTAPPPR